MQKTLTGWHVFGIFAGCFGVIITVNLTLAYQALNTFPGLVTKNSYIASQSFDADRISQDGLGWDVATDITNGTLTLAIKDATGLAVQPTVIKATLGRATHVADDMTPDFIWNGTALIADAPVQAGYWTLWLELEAKDGTPFRRRIPLTVKGT